MQQAIIEHIIAGLHQLIKQDMSKHVGETAYSQCTIQAGYHNFLKIVYKRGKIGFYLYDFDWQSTPDFRMDAGLLDDVAQADIITHVLPDLRQAIEEIFLKQVYSPMFDYCLQYRIELEQRAGCSYAEQHYLEDAGCKQQLRQRMSAYIETVMFEQQRPIKDSRELSVFCGQVLDLGLMDYTPARLIEILEQCHQSMSLIQNRKFKDDFERSILHQLSQWSTKKFLPLYCHIVDRKISQDYPLKADFEIEQVDGEKLQLFVYAALTRIKYGPYSFDSGFGCKDLERAAKEFGSVQAQQYLTKGTGQFADGDIYFKDVDVECNANDVFMTIKVTIKHEQADSYRKALDFIIHLLQQGFSHSYQIKLTSKAEKQFLPIKGIAKSSTHRFFAQALCYSCLHEKIAQYAAAAMKEFEYYTDVTAGEKSCLPGSYAVFGLGLTSEQYFPLVEQYFELLDDEHQSVHKYFISALIDRFGVTPQSAPLIMKGILSAQFEMVFKNLAAMLNDDNSTLLFDALTPLPPHDIEQVLYAIWGKQAHKRLKKYEHVPERLLLVLKHC